MKKIKILVIMPTLNKCGGIESFYMNYYKNLSNEFKIDFITYSNDSMEYKKQILSKGDRLFVFPKCELKNIFAMKNEIKKFFIQNHDYDIIHCQMANAAYFYFKEAKKYNIKVRIMHSHQCKYADQFLHAIRNIPLMYLGKKFSTNFMACGELAGKFMFKNKSFIIMNNAIDTNRFKYNEKIRKKIRDKYNIENKIVIGNIGRFSQQKNQMFLIDVLNNAVKLNKNIILLLIGSGKLKEKLIDKSKRLKLENNIIFVNSTDKIEEFYQAMDIFVLPSIYEGLPVVGIEAQAAGLPCIFSTTITKEVKINKDTVFIPIDNSELWASKIIKISENMKNRKLENIDNSQFNIKNETIKLEEYYKKII